ncbi:MAG: sulfite exporter TauE/SafE family protein, partial [Alphaproteobacteria bacterium]|nr:sulfite exporter TauE/SafE family protein [Alphaproteobacteria bacterium]
MTGSFPIDPLYSLSGFFVGVLVGQTGVGGGSLMTPLLVLLFGIHPATAVGTDLLFAAATKTVGTLKHGLHGTVNWRITGTLALGSVPATLLTLLAMSQFETLGPGSARLLTTGLGIALVLTSMALLSRRHILAYTARKMPWLDGPHVATATVVLGAVMGVLVTLSSVGSGAIGMTVLVILYRRTPLP